MKKKLLERIQDLAGVKPNILKESFVTAVFKDVLFEVGNRDFRDSAIVRTKEGHLVLADTFSFDLEVEGNLTGGYEPPAAHSPGGGPDYDFENMVATSEIVVSGIKLNFVTQEPLLDENGEMIEVDGEKVDMRFRESKETMEKVFDAWYDEYYNEVYDKSLEELSDNYDYEPDEPYVSDAEYDKAADRYFGR